MTYFFILCTYFHTQTQRMYLKDQHSTELNEGEQEPFVHVYIGAGLIFLH